MELDAPGDLPRQFPTTLHREVSAVPAQASLLRSVLIQWARDRGLPHELLEALGLASYEAMANVIVHAYPDGAPGTMTVTAMADDEALTITVTDSGLWDDNPSHHLHGRGFPLMRGLADKVILATAPEGTRVQLVWIWSPADLDAGEAG